MVRFVQRVGTVGQPGFWFAGPMLNVPLVSTTCRQACRAPGSRSLTVAPCTVWGITISG